MLKLPVMLRLLDRYRRYDPAARSLLEIALLYPGPKALLFYRLAHALRGLGVPFFPRGLTEFGRFLTGIDIHPGARIGRNLIIDHGMGVVIGETAVIGDDVIIYQGVTLGGTNLTRTQRHPRVGDRVVLGAGAKVLGAITIGHDSRIGANSVVVADVPDHATAVGIPARILAKKGVAPGDELSHHKITEGPPP